MEDIWRNTGAYYRQLKSNPPANAKALCSCINHHLKDEIHSAQEKLLGNLRLEIAGYSCVVFCHVSLTVIFCEAKNCFFSNIRWYKKTKEKKRNALGRIM
jgi:hypothetical protein